MQKYIALLGVVLALLCDLTGGDRPNAGAPADQPQITWESASPEAVAKAEQDADAEAKRFFALLYYSNAAENKVAIFSDSNIVEQFDSAWKKCVVNKTKRKQGNISVKVEYDFEIGNFRKNSDFRFLSGGIGREEKVAKAFCVARYEFQKLLAQKITSIRVSDSETLGEMASRNRLTLLPELALYLCRVSCDVPEMPLIKCRFSQGGGYNVFNESSNYSGVISYDLLLQDLAAVLRCVNGPNYEELKKYNSALPAKEMLNAVGVYADYDKIPKISDWSPDGVFAAAMAQLMQK